MENPANRERRLHSSVIVNDIEVLFGGQAGDGSLTTGDLIATVF